MSECCNVASMAGLELSRKDLSWLRSLAELRSSQIRNKVGQKPEAVSKDLLLELRRAEKVVGVLRVVEANL